MDVDSTYDSVLHALGEQVKARVEHVLEENGMSHAELGRRLGFKNDSGYWKMYSNGTFDLRKAASIAAILKVDPDRILLGRASIPDRSARPYVEDRLEAVERELRSLRHQMKKEQGPKK